MRPWQFISLFAGCAWPRAHTGIPGVLICAALTQSCLAQAQNGPETIAPSQSELIVGTKEAPPFAMKTPDGVWIGVSIDLWRHVADQLHLRYHIEAAVNEQSRAHKLNITVVTMKDREEAISALESGKVDGYAGDKLLLVGTQAKHPEALAMLPDDLSIEAYAIALPRGDWALRLAVNTGLAPIFRSGLIFEGFDRWFGPIGLQPGLLSKAAWALGALSD